ncbi:hypothetical protein PVIIG_05662 [Plasmodium vivax India VII]|uniref:Uncharacterized protein n=1 Tax=Plasmodium vivax India VII TaxID=1077284 RepID=A0A0J9UV05_PLAVI|nr:hypothetical protein PVIIG_05662 [Plasmodium vivax India VII]
MFLKEYLMVYILLIGIMALYNVLMIIPILKLLMKEELVHVPSSDEGTNGITGVDISTEYRAPDGASNSVKDSHDHPHGKEVSFIGTTYSTTPNTEITANNNDILSKVINAIQDNPQIIKTSAPIGIALLLGLLFKVN